jgi:hypothetical protein
LHKIALASIRPKKSKIKLLLLESSQQFYVINRGNKLTIWEIERRDIVADDPSMKILRTIIFFFLSVTLLFSLYSMIQFLISIFDFIPYISIIVLILFMVIDILVYVFVLSLISGVPFLKILIPS